MPPGPSADSSTDAASPGAPGRPAAWGAGVAALLALWAAMWLPVLSGRSLLYARDLLLFAAPMKSYLLGALASGHFPWWTSAVAGGMPYFADASNQVLYPANLLFRIAPNAITGVSWYVVAHHGLALAAFLVLARSLRASPAAATWGAVAWALSGYVVSITDNVNYLPATVWVPAGLAAFVVANEGRRITYAVACAGCAALLVLAGDPLDAVLMLALCALLGVVRRSPGSLRQRRDALTLVLGIGTLAALLAAVQILPTLDLARVSVRAGGLDAASRLEWSFPLRRTLELVQPFLFGSRYPALDFLAPELYPTFHGPWADSVYLGAPTVLLAALYLRWRSRAALPWALAAGAAFVLALGVHGPFAGALLDWVPLLDTQRYPEKLILWVTLAACVLATGGLDEAWRRWAVDGPPRRPLLVRLLACALAALALFYGLADLPLHAWLWTYADKPSALWWIRFDRPVTHAGGVLLHTALTAAVLVPGLAFGSAGRRRWLVAVAVFALVDLAWMHVPQVPTAPAALLTQPPSAWPRTVLRAGAAGSATRIWFDGESPGETVAVQPGPLARRVTASLRARGDPLLEGLLPIYAALFHRARLHPNAGIARSVAYLNGSSSPLEPLVAARQTGALLGDHTIALLERAGVADVVTGIAPANPAWAHPALREVWRDPALNLRLLALPDPRPRASLATSIAQATPEGAVTELRRLVAAGSATVVESPPGAAHGARGRTRVTLDRPGRIDVAVQAQTTGGNALLVVTENALPGWTASVDGRPATLRRADGRWLAVEVGAGRHVVRFRYRAPWLRTGAVLSVLGLLLASLALVRDLWRARRVESRVSAR